MKLLNVCDQTSKNLLVYEETIQLIAFNCKHFRFNANNPHCYF